MKKYEQEIRELLEKMDRENFVQENPAAERERDPRRKTIGVVPPAPRPIRPKPAPKNGLRKWLAENKGLTYMLFGYALVISGLILHSEVMRSNSSPLFWLVQLLIAVGALFFLAPVFIKFFTGREVDSGPKTWRGEVVYDEPVFNWEKVKTWFGGGKNKRGRNDPWNNNRRNDRW